TLQEENFIRLMLRMLYDFRKNMPKSQDRIFNLSENRRSWQNVAEKLENPNPICARPRKSQNGNKFAVLPTKCKSVRKHLRRQNRSICGATTPPHLLDELAGIREMVLRVPATLQTKSALQSAIDRIWRVEEDVRFLLSLQRDMQTSFARKAAQFQGENKQETLKQAQQGPALDDAFCG